MTSDMHSLHVRLRAFATAAGLIAMCGSAAVLCGWAMDIPWLLGFSTRFVTMKPPTAAGFFFSGLSLWLLAPGDSIAAARRRFAQASAFLVALVGVATLVEFASGLDLHFENILFRHALYATGIPNPGRPSIATSLGFTFLGIAFILLDRETSRGWRPAEFLCFAAVLLALLNTLGYIYDVRDLYRTFHNNSMAVHTAVLFLLLGLGGLAARPDRGFVGILNGPGVAGRMARQLLPASTFFIVMIGWFRLMGERLGFYGTSFGLALFASSNITMFCILVLLAARSMSASEEQLGAATRELALSNDRADQTNARLAAIVESSDDAVISKTLGGIITSWNSGAERIFGYSAEVAVGQPMLMLFPHDRIAEEALILNRVAKGEAVEHFESARIRNDGTRILVSATVSPVRDASGTIIGASTIARDITDSRRIERAIEEGEARFSAIIGAAMDAVITIDEQQRVTMFNPAAEKMFGCSAQNALGQTLDRFIPKRFRADHAHHVGVFGDTHVTRRQMGRIGSIYGLRSSGEEFPIEASISHAQVHGQKLFTAIIRDVTESKRAQEEFRQQASLLDLAPVVVRDMDNRIILWTRGAQQLYGYSKQEATGRISHELLKTQFPGPRAEIEDALHRQGDWEGELSHATSDGRRVFVASQWVLHHDAEGKPVRILEVNTDITERKRAQASQLRSQKLESLGTLAGGVAHDFNNILLAINGNAKLAMSDLPPDHPVQESLSEIAKAGARAADLVRRILAFSRPQEQKHVAQPFQPVIEEALKLVRATLPASIQIETHFPPSLPAVAMDSTQIHQVIVNLATNASHAIGDKPGTIDVRLTDRMLTPDDLLANPDLRQGRYVLLCVSDSGCGMDRATLDRIFDPFFTTKPVGQGTGLGLSVVHGIVSSHEGAISVYSQPGQGTAFNLYFPAVEAAVRPALSVQKPSARPERSEHLLYVDDEEGLVFLGTRVLQRLGYKVTGHTDANVALDDFRSRPNDFAAVITDLSMPRMSGFALARELMKVRPGVPIIMTSGYVRPEDQAAAEALGIHHVILKPSTADDLGRALDDLLTKEVSVATPEKNL
jgi:PAS domain S-box-containing protein